MNQPNPAPSRVVMHVDMDAFYVSVELLRHPELRGRPVVVGGTGARGVVAAASYEARQYGIFSAMPSARAKRLCPQAVFLAGDHGLYREVSQRLLNIYRSYSPLVEPLALDEAFIDVSGATRLHGSGAEIAIDIRTRVLHEEGLVASVGVASSKFVAKLASVAAKPTVSTGKIVEGVGIKVLNPAEEVAFVQALPVERLWGVGPATHAKLSVIGVKTVGDLALIPLPRVATLLGKAAAEQLHSLAHAVDHRSVVPNAMPKSLSHEETFANDLYDWSELHREILRQSDGVARRLRKSMLVGRTVSLKLRYGDFETVTRSRSLHTATNSAREIAQTAKELLEKAQPDRGVRLVGVGIAGLVPSEAAIAEQLSLFADKTGAHADVWNEADSVLDAIRDRFGEDAIGPAATITEEGLRPTRRGSQQWGPNEK